MVGAICCGGDIKRELSFEEILLDETLVQGKLWILKDALRRAGGINYRLKAKRNYEMILRIARNYVVLQQPEKEGTESFFKEEKIEKAEWILFSSESDIAEEADPEEGVKTDCYLIGRYKAELLDMGSFDDAVLGIISSGKEEEIQYLEQMIGETEVFYDLYDCTQPILLYTGSTECYQVLDTFSKCLGKALESLGQNVEYFDVSKHHIEELSVYLKRRYKSVIGMQTYMFSVRWKEGGLAHNRVKAPKYNFVFDHPIWFREHLREVPDGLHVLTPDRNYAVFIEKYYEHSARFFPPAGKNEVFYKNGQRDYEVSFLGTYSAGLVQSLWNIRKDDRRKAYIINRFVLNMRKHLKETPEAAFEKALEVYGILYDREKFVEEFYKVRWIFYGLSAYYRGKVIEALVKAGIVVHVFGSSWRGSPVWMHSGLIFHDKMIGTDALKVYARSKVSLNVMTWHKDGFTERIANAMLQRSVVVTDKTTYLENHFVDGEEILLFDLAHIQELPGRIKVLLQNEAKREQIAEHGCRKALTEHTWDQRAAKILEWIEKDRTE